MLGRYEPGSVRVHQFNIKPTRAATASATNAVQVKSTVTPYIYAAVGAYNTNSALTAPLDTVGNVYVCNAANSLVGCVKVKKGTLVELPPYGDLSQFYVCVNSNSDSCTVIYTTQRNVDGT